MSQRDVWAMEEGQRDERCWLCSRRRGDKPRKAGASRGKQPPHRWCEGPDSAECKTRQAGEGVGRSERVNLE